MVELLLVLALVGILAAVATPQYRNWRANVINAEAVTAVEQAIAVSRQQAKRTGTDVTLSLSGDQSTLLRGAHVIEIPNGGTIQTGGAPISLTFIAPLGSQAPFDIVTFDVRTGSGATERTATISVIPPLAKTAVTR